MHHMLTTRISGVEGGSCPMWKICFSLVIQCYMPSKLVAWIRKTLAQQVGNLLMCSYNIVVISPEILELDQFEKPFINSMITNLMSYWYDLVLLGQVGKEGVYAEGERNFLLPLLLASLLLSGMPFRLFSFLSHCNLNPKWHSLTKICLF